MVPIIGGEAVQAEEPAENDGAPPSLVDELMRQVRARENNGSNSGRSVSDD